MGADSYTLSGGESIQWLYTCNLGADVGNTYMAEKRRQRRPFSCLFAISRTEGLTYPAAAGYNLKVKTTIFRR